MLTYICYPKCKTCQKAKTLLDSHSAQIEKIAISAIIVLLLVFFSSVAYAEEGYEYDAPVGHAAGVPPEYDRYGIPYEKLLFTFSLKPKELLTAGVIAEDQYGFITAGSDAYYIDFWIYSSISQPDYKDLSILSYAIIGDRTEFDPDNAEINYTDGTVEKGIREIYSDGEILYFFLDPSKHAILREIFVPRNGVDGNDETTFNKFVDGVCVSTSINDAHIGLYTGFGEMTRPSRPYVEKSIWDVLYYDRNGVLRHYLGDLPANPYIPLAHEQTDKSPADIPAEQPSAWAAEQVNTAIAMGLAPTDLQARYTDDIMRVEFCKLIITFYEGYKGYINVDKTPFIDTDDIYIKKAAKLGIVYGDGEDRFAPRDTLTREEAAVILARLAEIAGAEFTYEELAEGDAPFADSDDISDWAIGLVGQICAAGIMQGNNGNFAPKEPFTVEEGIVTIVRLYNYIESVK